jgi:hypothetical protein
MNTPVKQAGFLLLALALLLSACRAQTEAPTPTTDPGLVLTAAAETAVARGTQQALATASAQVPTATVTPTLTQPSTATITPTLATQAITQQPAQTGIDWLSFVADVTVADGTTFKPGETFTKTWRLLNQGTTTWTTAYSLVFVSGNQMGGAASVPLTVQVAPGATLDISVNLTAPASAGSYTGNWMLRNAAGKNFGLGPNADVAFYVQINVAGAATTTATVTTTTTPGASVTQGPSPTATVATATVTQTPEVARVTSAQISVDQADVTGSCPHSFNFTAQFELSREAQVTYQLEAETGFPLSLPAPTTLTLSAGPHTVVYNLQFTATLSGWARLHITAPNDLVSDQVNFSLTCN